MGELELARTPAFHRLSPTFVWQCATPGVYQDGGGLELGAFPMILWAEARSRAGTIRKAVTEDRDPVQKKQAAGAVAAPQPIANPPQDERPTFEHCWHPYWAAKEPQLSNGRHREQWVATMNRHGVLRISIQSFFAATASTSTCHSSSARPATTTAVVAGGAAPRCLLRMAA